MVETLKPQPAFAASLPQGRYGFAQGPPGVVARRMDNPAMALVMMCKDQEEQLASLVMHLHGLILPTRPRRVAKADVAWIGLAPSQWLVTGAKTSPLATSLAGIACVSDQSDSRAVLYLTGPKLRETLTKGIPLDVHPSSFKPGDAAATMASLVSTWLWMLDDAPTFEMAVPRSMASSFAAWLVASAAEFGLLVE